jgi:hypothetical protein
MLLGGEELPDTLKGPAILGGRGLEQGVAQYLDGNTLAIFQPA